MIVQKPNLLWSSHWVHQLPVCDLISANLSLNHDQQLVTKETEPFQKQRVLINYEIYTFFLCEIKYNVRGISHGSGQLWGKGGLGFATGRVHYTSHVECRAVTLGTRRLGTSMLLSLIEEIHAFETVLRRNGSDAFFARACRCCRCFEIRVQMWLTQ